jgi:hypothetical protein
VRAGADDALRARARVGSLAAVVDARRTKVNGTTRRDGIATGFILGISGDRVPG